MFQGPSMLLAGGAVIGTYINKYANTGNATTYNFTSSDFGTAFAGRRILVAVAGAFSSRNISSVTIGGVSATILVQRQSNAGSSELTTGFVIAEVPTGTSGTISVTWSGSQNGCAIAIWSLAGLAADAALDTDSDPANAALSLTTKPGSFIAAVLTNENSRTVTWGGSFTEHFDESYDGAIYWSGASQQASGSSTSVAPTLSGSATKTPLCAVSF